MTSAAEALYGPNDAAAPTSHATPGQAEHAALAGRMYDKPADTPSNDASKFWDNDSAIVRNAIRERVETAIDNGLIDPTEADEIVIGLSREVESLNIEGEDLLLREIHRPADHETATKARGQANRWLREAYGDAAPQVLQAANKWLAGKAPGIAKMMSMSRAGNNVEILQSVVRAYERDTRKRRS